jgi:phage terminase Nu1 subunit (DNA packaging protein)
VTHQELADKLGVARSYVTRLAAKGMPTTSPEAANEWRRAHSLPRARRGAPPAAAPDLVSARVAVLEEQRKEIALRNARTLNQFVPIAYLQNVLAAVTSELGARLEAMPARLRMRHPELPHDVLTELSTTIAELRNQAVAEVERAAANISATAPWRAPWEDDDDDDDDELDDEPQP